MIYAIYADWGVYEMTQKHPSLHGGSPESHGSLVCPPVDQNSTMFYAPQQLSPSPGQLLFPFLGRATSTHHTAKTTQLSSRYSLRSGVRCLQMNSKDRWVCALSPSGGLS